MITELLSFSRQHRLCFRHGLVHLKLVATAVHRADTHLGPRFRKFLFKVFDVAKNDVVRFSGISKIRPQRGRQLFLGENGVSGLKQQAQQFKFLFSQQDDHTVYGGQALPRIELQVSE